jgi:hypothetical protein
MEELDPDAAKEARAARQKMAGMQNVDWAGSWVALFASLVTVFAFALVSGTCQIGVIEGGTRTRHLLLHLVLNRPARTSLTVIGYPTCFLGLQRRAMRRLLQARPYPRGPQAMSVVVVVLQVEEEELGMPRSEGESRYCRHSLGVGPYWYW